MSNTIDSFALARYAVLFLCGAIALRSLVRLAQRGLNTTAFVFQCKKLLDAKNYERLAKLTAAAGERPAALLLARALSLKIPTVAEPTGEQEHFRDGGAPGEPFELAWKRAMDTAQNALRLEILTDLGAAIGASSVAAIVAAIGAAMATDRSGFARNSVVAVLLMMLMFAAANSGRSLLSGLVAVRAFCEAFKQPVEEMGELQRSAANIAQSQWRNRATPAQGAGTDV